MKLSLKIISLLITVFLLGTTNSFADKDIKIFTVKEEGVKTDVELFIIVNDDLEAIGLRMRDHADDDMKTYDISQIPSGLPLKVVDGRKVIVISSQDFESDRGGDFVLTYLRNGITNKRKNFSFKLDFDGGNWQPYRNGSPISTIYIYKNRIPLLRKVIGIKKVVGE